ncbi:hypothetical protein PanWU01x14_158670, partial [Parasponia andersonii]
FPTQYGVGEVRGNQYNSRTCYNNSIKLTAKDITPRTMMVQQQGEASREVPSKASREASGETSIDDLDP